MRHLATLLALAALAGAPSVAPGVATADFLLDAFTDEFPASPCLPNSGARVVFDGVYCDGAACPPDPWVDAGSFGSACMEHLGAGLAGVFEGSRYVDALSEGTAFASLRVLPATQRLEVAFGAGADARVAELWYDGGFGATMDWNYDLSTVLAVSFVLEGDVSPARPAHLVVMFDNLDPPALPLSRWIELDLTSPGAVVLPLGAFSSDPGFDMTSVDMINVRFEVPPGSVPAHDFRIGPIALVTDAGTPSRATSWGRLKTLYR